MTSYDLQSNPNYVFGHSKEKEAQHIICRVNDVSVVKEQDNSNYWNMLYDFKTSDGLKYEVKANKKSTQYKTFYIETMQSVNDGPFKKSGLLIAKSHYWMFWHGDVFYKIQQVWLKRLIKENKRVYKSSSATPNHTNKTKGIIVPVKDVEELSIVYRISDYHKA